MSLAARDPRTPWYARLVIVIVVSYALSPIDLIPDFIPVLGYLDDLLLLPFGLFFSLNSSPRRSLPTPGKPLSNRTAVWPRAASRRS